MIGTLLHFDPTPNLAELAELGYSAAFHPGLIGCTSIEAAWEYANDFRARDVAAEADWKKRPQKYPIQHVFGMFDLVGFPQVVEWEKKYLPASAMKKYEGSTSMYDPRQPKA